VKLPLRRLFPERPEERANSPRREAVGRMKLLESVLWALPRPRCVARNEPVPFVARAVREVREVRAPPVNDPVRRPTPARVCGRDQPLPPRRMDDCASRFAAVVRVGLMLRLRALRVVPR